MPPRDTPRRVRPSVCTWLNTSTGYDDLERSWPRPRAFCSDRAPRPRATVAAMFWYVLGAIAAALFLFSVASPTLRRIWVFTIYSAKYLALGLGEVIGIRRLAARMRGRRYERLTRPVALRLFCEDMGPTFIKFGQI